MRFQWEMVSFLTRFQWEMVSFLTRFCNVFLQVFMFYLFSLPQSSQHACLLMKQEQEEKGLPRTLLHEVQFGFLEASVT